MPGGRLAVWPSLVTFANVKSVESDSVMKDKENNQSLWRAILKYVVPLVITVGLCYMLFSKVNFGEMVEIIKRDCDFWWIGLALLISIFSHVFRAMRWRIQLEALNIPTPLTPLVYSIFGTYAVNLVFPRLGEVWRTGYIAQRQNAPFTTVFGSMVADRLADTVTVATLTVVTFLLASGALLSYVKENPAAYEGLMGTLASPWFWLAVVAVVSAVWWLFTAKLENKIVKKTRSAAKDLWDGFAVVAHMKGKGRWLVLTVLIWGCYFSQLYVAFFAFPFTTEVVANHGALAVLVCFALSSIAMGVPSNGGIGPWQYAIIFGLAIYMPQGVDKAVYTANSTAFANLVLGAQTCLLIILGLWTFVYIALSKKRGSAASKTVNG